MAEDRISMLPDSILCHILSFLSTEDAVATSLLSKRWISLFLSVPSLDFDDERDLKHNELNPCFYTTYRNLDYKKLYSCFATLVYGAILARPLHQPIKRFRLKCVKPGHPFASDLQIWVNAAVQRGIEHLDVRVKHASHKLSRLCIFNCRTLVVLKLNGLYLDAISSVDLPSLKTLHLNDVEFLDTPHFVQLLNGCPVLEDLQAKEIYFDSDSYSSVGDFKSLPNLDRADISIVDIEIPLEAICNVEFLRYKDLFGTIPVFPNLTHMELIYRSYIEWHWIFEIIQHCPKLQFFSLCNCKIDRLMEGPEVWAYPQVVPECISSQLRRCSLINYEGEYCELQFAKYIMQNSRALRTMTIHSFPSSNPQDKIELLKELSLCPKSSAACELLLK